MKLSRCKHVAVSVLGRVVVLAILALALAATTNALSPRGIGWTGPTESAVAVEVAEGDMRLAELKEVRQIIDEGLYIVLDARSSEKFVEGHLPGAISMPVKQAAEMFAELQILLTPDQPVLVYCSGRACDQSLRLGRFLRDQGVKQVALFEGGMEVWREAQLDVAQGE